MARRNAAEAGGRGRRAPVTEAAASPVLAPPGLTAAVMSQIRVLARDVWYTLQSTILGPSTTFSSTRISNSAQPGG